MVLVTISGVLQSQTRFSIRGIERELCPDKSDQEYKASPTRYYEKQG